jgi:TetR/AcrR family transcriptional repressor of nem operon
MSRVTNTRENIIDTAHRLIWENSYGSVSVDDICKKAGVRKGSFYHFFPSKLELAIIAMEDHWQKSKPELDKIFTDKKTLKRIIKEFAERGYFRQKEQYEKIGRVCGCPYASLGAEISCNEEVIREHTLKKIKRLVGYFESALKNAAKKGEIEKTGVKEKAEEMHSFIIGVLVNAKIQNDLNIIKRDLESGLLKIAGVSSK